MILKSEKILSIFSTNVSGYRTINVHIMTVDPLFAENLSVGRMIVKKPGVRGPGRGVYTLKSVP